MSNKAVSNLQDHHLGAIVSTFNEEQTYKLRWKWCPNFCLLEYVHFPVSCFHLIFFSFQSFSIMEHASGLKFRSGIGNYRFQLYTHTVFTRRQVFHFITAFFVFPHRLLPCSSSNFLAHPQKVGACVQMCCAVCLCSDMGDIWKIFRTTKNLWLWLKEFYFVSFPQNQAKKSQTFLCSVRKEKTKFKFKAFTF